MMLRSLTALISLLLHGGAVAFFLVTPGGASLESGTGDDTFVIEQGIAIEGVSSSGDAAEYQELVEAPPPVLQTQQAVEEVKPVEEDVQHVIGADTGPEQEKIAREPEPEEVKEKPTPEKVATLQQTEIAREEVKASGQKQEGGNATAVSVYRGKLFAHISGKKINPRSRDAGVTVVRFTVGPDGELMSREIATSSGSKTLDDAAIASIEKAAPFPPMPSEVKKEPMVVSVPFRFTVR
jgi:periplasmic protein TonB